MKRKITNPNTPWRKGFDGFKIKTAKNESIDADSPELSQLREAIGSEDPAAPVMPLEAKLRRQDGDS